MNTYIKLEWYNSCDLHGALYSAGLVNSLYLDADAARAEYSIEEEGTESLTGVFSLELQRWTKRVNIDFLAPEYLIDALHYGALCDNFLYYDKFGGVTRCENVAVEHEWIEGDCFALCTLSFDVAKIVKTLCANLTLGSDV